MNDCGLAQRTRAYRVKQTVKQAVKPGQTCAGPIGFERVRDVNPGEMIIITQEGELRSKQVGRLFPCHAMSHLSCHCSAHPHPPRQGFIRSISWWRPTLCTGSQGHARKARGHARECIMLNQSSCSTRPHAAELGSRQPHPVKFRSQQNHGSHVWRLGCMATWLLARISLCVLLGFFPT